MYHNAEQSHPPAPEHQVVRELLPEYVTRIALGQQVEELYPQVAEHLKHCTTCRAERDELQDLVVDAYTAQVESAAHYPTADLSFLSDSQESTEIPPFQPWLIDSLGRLVITFTEQLLTMLRQPSLVTMTRGQLLYRYIQEPETVQDMEVTIEVFSDDTAKDIARVQVLIDVPSRDPLNQMGNLVTLRFGDVTWQGETDESGYVTFASVPLVALRQMRIEVLRRRAV